MSSGQTTSGWAARPWAPWAGLAAAAAAVALNHQILADTVYFDCSRGNPLTVSATSVIALLLTIGGGLLSWRARGRGEDQGPEPRSRRFLALLSVMAAALAVFAIVLQLMAGMIVPTCAR